MTQLEEQDTWQPVEQQRIWEQSHDEKSDDMMLPNGCPHRVIRLCTSCAGAVVYCAACWFEWRTPWAPVWGDCAHHRPVERR